MIRWWQQDDAFAQDSYVFRPPGHIGRYDADCACGQCRMAFVVLTYMFEAMEPTDRALWPVPAPRLVIREPA